MTRLLLSVGVLALCGAPLLADDDHDKAKATIEKAIKAAGWDKDTATTAHTWKDKGKFSGGGMEATYTSEAAFVGPDKYRAAMLVEIDSRAIQFIVQLNGDKGAETGFGMTRELEAEKLEYVKASVYRQWVQSLVPLVSDKEFTLKPLAEAKVNNAAAVGVEVTRKGKPTVKLYFDAKTGLPVKSEMTVKNEFNEWKDVLDEVYLSGWKDAGGGRKMFAAMKIVRGGKTMIDAELTESKAGEKLDPKTFDLPGK